MMWREYWRAFRIDNLKRMWKSDKESWFAPFYLMVYPLLFGGGFTDRHVNENILLYVAVLIPMVFVIFSEIIHPVRLPKIMYLCPMTDEKRREMIRNGYYFRVCLHWGVMMIGLLAVIIYSSFDPILAVEYAINSLLLSMMITIEKKYGKGYQGIVAVVAIFSNIIMASSLMDRDDSLLLKLLMLGLIIAIQLPFMRLSWIYIRCELEDAVYYEAVQEGVR